MGFDVSFMQLIMRTIVMKSILSYLKNTRHVQYILLTFFAFILVTSALKYNELTRQKAKISEYQIGSLNLAISEQEVKLNILSKYLRKAYDDFINPESFIDFMCKNIFDGYHYGIEEIAILDGDNFLYVNHNGRGTKEAVLPLPEMIPINDYFISLGTYKSRTTDKISMFLYIPIGVDKGLLAEFDIESMFPYMDINSDYIYITNRNNNFIYHPNKKYIGTEAPSILKHSKYETWIKYNFEGEEKRAKYNNSNPFGWNVFYSYWEDSIYYDIEVNIIILIVLLFVSLFVLLELKSSFHIESMTGLKTKASFNERRIKNKKVNAFCFIDIDHFKSINDRYGHTVGDNSIKMFAKLLKDNIREHDIAYRWGGEEFLLILRSADGKKLDTEMILNRIREKTESMNIDEIPNFTISIGFCNYNSGLSMQKHILRADKALYKAKRTGRNKVVEY